MSKMGTSNRKGRKSRRVLLLSLLLAVVLAVSGLVGALAAGYGEFKIMVGGDETTLYQKNSYLKQDWFVAKSAAEKVINFRTDRVFYTTDTKTEEIKYWSWTQWAFVTDFSNVKSLKIVVKGAGPGQALQVEVEDKKVWQLQSNGSDTTLTYLGRSALTRTQFNNLMGQISVRYTPSDKATDGAEATATIYAYTDKSSVSGQPITATYNGMYTNSHSCKLIFYRFAEGAVDESSTEMDYKASYQADYNQTYEQAIGSLSNVRVTPDDSNQGRAKFTMNITNPGTGGSYQGNRFGYEADIGYQIKESGRPWANDVRTVIVKKGVKLRNNSHVYDDIDIEVTGLNAGVTYAIRGVVITDGKTTMPRNTNEVTVSYQKPVIGTFTTSNTAKVYEGGKDYMEITMAAAFRDQNTIKENGTGGYTGLSYTDAYGSPKTGPWLKAQLYFTTNRNFTEEAVGGSTTQTTYGDDNSTWYSVGTVERKGLLDGNGTVATSMNNSWSLKLPATMDDILKNGDDTPINSTKCAYKLVVTDLYTGYSVYRYSDPFTIDSTPPSGTIVRGFGGDGVEMGMGLDTCDTNVVGGSNSKVSVAIGGASDGDGSGIKEYSYRMWYLPTKDGQALKDTREGVLRDVMSKYTSDSDCGTATYSEWSAAPFIQETDAEGKPVTNEDGTPKYKNRALVTVSKDGYYRVDAKAVDNAGKESTVVQAFFQVDLSAPETPKIALVKQNGELITEGENAGSTLYKASESATPQVITAADVKADPAANTSPYDNRTYTSSVIWLFAYSEPKAGKTLQTFEYSTDGGLTWTDFRPMAGGVKDANNSILETANVAGGKSVAYYPKGTYAGNGENFYYQGAVNVSGEGNDDYTAFLVRAKDTLGNVSLASEAAVMRTVGKAPQATSVLQHKGIEVALAIGNTSISSTTLTADLKNAAAKKINAKYYGEEGQGTDPKGENFNPWLYIKNFVDPTEQSYGKANVKMAGHNCNWESDASCAGACHGVTKGSDGNYMPATCPYAVLKNLGYEVYFPEMVNVQGVAGADANDTSQFQWTKFDHTMFNWMTYTDNSKDGGGATKQIQIPTVSYISNTNCITNLKGNPRYATYNYNGETRYTASKDRVVYLGQTDANARDATTGLPTEDYNSATNSASPGTTLMQKWTGFGIWCWYDGNAGGGFPANGQVITAQKYQGGPNVTYTYRSIPAVDTYNAAGHWYKENNYDDWNAQGYGVKGWGEATIARRIYHILNTSASSDPVNGYSDLSRVDEVPMTTIAGYNGYLIASLRDWLFLYNDQSARKEISFSITDNQINAHSADFDGFLFNTTIRQNTAGEWRISGYMFMHGDSIVETVGTPRPPTYYKWWIIKINDVNLEHFADGCLKTGGVVVGSRVDDDLPLYGITHPTSSGPFTIADGGSLETIAYSEPDTTAVGTRHYKLITDTGKTTMYVFNTGNDTSYSYTTSNIAKNLDAIWKRSDLASTAMPNASTTSGYKAINWKQYYGSSTYIGTTLDTPRPTVDGLEIGSKEARTAGYHKDTNCYGFGPIVGARSAGHGCYIDSRVVYTNVKMRINVTRSLADVVNEPQWGGGQAKFIANISDDSTEDFEDPVLSSQIQWRLFTDQARFIGWGIQDFEDPTMKFINRIEGDGTYEVNDIDNRADADAVQTTKLKDQVDNVATYITQEYYTSLGFDGTATSGTITSQAGEVMQAKGAVFTLNNAQQMKFSVTPEKYNTSTANPDFPSGRWYIVHDARGYQTVTDKTDQEAVTARYSDGLDLSITQPGRYTVYFAPDEAKVKAQTLDPADAVFDFVVNTPPVAQFTGSLEGTKVNPDDPDSVETAPFTVKIEDSANDPDTNTLAADGTVPASNYSYTYRTYNEDGTYTEHTEDFTGAPVGGIVRTEWRWEILDKQFNEDDETYTMKTIASSAVQANGEDPVPNGGWSTDSPNGKTLENLTNGHVSKQGWELYTDKPASFKSLNSGAVLTVYQRVFDVSARRVKNANNPDGSFGGYKFVAANNGNEETVSNVSQQNLASKQQITYAPLSAMSLSDVNLYTTSPDDSVIILERNSKQTQKRTDYEPSFYADISGYEGLSGYHRLIEYTPTHDYYLAPKTFYDKEGDRMDIYGAAPCTYKADTMEELTGAPLDNVGGERQGGYGVAADAEPVLKCVTAPSVSTEGQTIGQASGKWSISKNTVKRLSGSSGKLAIQLCETIQGLTQQDYKDMEADDTLVINPHDITGSSARTINYNQDKSVPTGTKVTAVIELWDEEAVNEDGTTGAWVETEYQANNYLDVTGGKARIKIHADGAKDGEGSVAGYGYYFYTKSQVGKNTSGVSDALYESEIYYLAKDAEGNLKLTRQPIVYNGVTYDVAKEELDSTSAWNRLSDEQKTAAIKEARKQAIAKSEALPSDGGDIIISMDAIGLGEPDPDTGKVTPTASLNVAIFAYDNAASANAAPVDSLTGSNESQKSRMEGIKLSTSEPMPPVIIATDTNNAKMAYIGNDSGYTDVTTTDKAWEYSFSASDASMTVRRYAGTDVTVQFNPRKARFAIHDQSTGRLEPDENGNEYYEDIYHNADLTGTAEVLYTVLYKSSESSTEEWRVYQNSAGEELEGVTMPSAQILTFTEEGCYQVTGQIVNGAGVASETRTIEFIIDKTAPDGDPNTAGQNPLRVSFVTEDGEPYVPGTCAKTVTMYVEPASDTNGNHTDAYFEYTRDGGQTWHRVGSHQSQDGTAKASLSSTQSEVFGHEDWDAGSGDYTVRVRAVDPAGNVTYGEQDVNVRIDRTAPEVHAPSLKVDSTTEPIYGNYVIRLKYYQEMGSVYSIVDDGKPDYISTEIAVTPGGKAVIYFHPQDGKQLGTVTCGGKEYTAGDLMTDPDHNDDYYLTLENVQQDYTVDVTFEDVEVRAQTFMMRARSSFEPYFAAMPALYEAEAEPAAQDAASGTEEAGGADAGGTGESGGAGDSGETETDPTRRITVQAYAGGGGYIDMDDQDTTGGQKKLTVAEGDVVHVTVTMVKGYTLSKVTMAGREYTDFESESALFKKQEDGSYVGDITVDAALLPADQGNDLLIIASFEEIKERTLRVTWSDSGSVSLVGYLSNPVSEENTAVYQVAEDSDVTFQMKPQDAKYWVKSLTIDGVEVTKDATGAMPVYTYHVPKLAEGEENKEIVAHVKFDVEDLSDAFSFDVSALVSTDGEFHGSIFPCGTAAEGNEVMVPANGSRTFTITPEPRYRLKKLWLSQMDTEGVLTAVDVTANVDKNTGRYTLEASSNGTLEAEFEMITYSIGRTSTGRGTIGVALKDPQPGESLNLNSVPVGRALVITAEPDEGYQLVNLEYETDSTIYQVGAVSRLVLENGITGNTTIKATFTQRQVDSNKTTHSITATADYVKDNESLLAAEPYRFRIMDASGRNVSAWTPWSSKNYYTFYGITPQGSTETIPLKPNTQYFVELQARDNVGNISSEMALNGSGTGTVQKPANSSSMKYIYTKANQPSTNGARAIDTADSYTKDVALGVKANGNPDSTEYLVYYSESSTMADMKVANLPKDNTDPDAGWSVLTNGEFIVTGLTPGVKYYLQVVARNEEGEITELDPNDITSITVSPAAPPENSLWFEEQESPVGGVKLTWELPAGSVTGVVIYRESEVILERDNVEDLSFVDTFEGMNNTQGDAIYNYSYAFKNEAGVGSTRQAISKEYHDLILAVNKDDTDLVAKERLDAADNLEKKGGEEVFTEALMYPVFPTGVRVIKATAAESSSVGTDHSGVIQVRVNSSSSRNQKYFLTLKAYEKYEDGTYSTEPVAGNLWDPDGTWHNADGSQKWNETKSTSSGATATWNNLASAYEYRVFVEEIRSTGAVSGSDGYGGERAGTGVEGLLRKTYIVNEDGYKTEFRTTDPDVQSLIDTAGLATVNKSWAELEDGTRPDSDKYTSSHTEKWDSPLSEYIAFNKTPHVKLAKDPYAGNSQEKLKEEGGNQYLLIDDGMEDQHFTLKVSAWDTDGYSQLTNHAAPYVEGEINKRTAGKADLGIDPADPNAREPKPMPKLELWNTADGGPTEKPDAYGPDGNLYTAESNPYTVTFDADSLATGEYTNAVLRACDGETVAEEPYALIHVLVNHATPIVTLKSGERQQIEKGSVFDLKNYEIAASVAKESNLDLQEGQNRVAVKVMPEQYQAAFGSADYNTILGYLTGGREAAEAEEAVVKAALDKAKELLGKDADKYVDTEHPAGAEVGFLTREGAVWAMGRVAPPVEAYVEIGEADYNSLYASFSEAQRKTLLRKETEGDTSLYWLQWEEALNRGLCGWMTKQADGSALVTGEAGKAYYLELVASVGGNQAATPITFEVKKAPSVSIVGDQRLGWTTTDIDTEYEDFKKLKVSEIQTKYADIVADGNVIVEDVADPETTEAGRPTDRVDEKGNQLYEIYTLYDTKARVSTSSIQSSVEMEFGIYNQFDEVGVLFSTDPPAVFNPNRDPIPNTMLSASVKTTGGGSTFTNPGNNKTIVRPFSRGELELGEEYYLWSYFRINAENSPSGEEVLSYSTNYRMITTESMYAKGYYSFEAYTHSVAEKNYLDSPVGSPAAAPQQLTINRSNCDTAGAKLRLEAKYYQADEFGNIITRDQTDEGGNPVLDEEGNPVQVPVELTGEQLAWAKQAVTFSNGSDSIEIDATKDVSRVFENLQLRYQPKQQGHMVVRVVMTVIQNLNEHCYTVREYEYTDVFVEDKESPVSTFVLGVKNQDDKGDPVMTEIMEGEKLSFYEYQFKGLPNEYTDLSENRLTVKYVNKGTGDLTGITAAVYEDQAGTKASTRFEVSLPSKTYLTPESGGGASSMPGSVTVKPVSGLEDGVYDAWLFLSAEHMAEKDVVKIHLYQVVGQSTLRGRIYITPEKPVSSHERTGVSKVYLYDSKAVFDRMEGNHAVFNQLPAYTAETDETGFFTIENIVNQEGVVGSYGDDKTYFIVVERDGFVTMNGGSNDLAGKLETINYYRQGQLSLHRGQSRTYEFNLRLLGGDVDPDQDQNVRDGDLETLISYYNQYYNPDTEPQTEEEKVLRRCDFNQDSVVNALDRFYLILNMGSSVTTYGDAYAMLEPEPETE